MSLQWTFIATFLCTELFVCFLLLLPFISATRWQKIFKSKILGFFRSYANLYFNIFIVVLVILFVDAIRDVRKYSNEEPDLSHPSAETNIHMKLFRAQRNFYIAGFTLFLFFILRRLVTTISNTASLEANCATMKKQAESANAVAKQLMEEKDNKSNEKEEGAAQKALEAVNEKEIQRLKDELTKALKDLEAMKKQTESTNREYDRMLKEHATLQETCKAMEGAGETKKDE